jgi:hypothetical protein
VVSGASIKPNWDGLQAGFFDFLDHVTILSKDEGRVQMEMYDAQRYFFDEIFDGLRRDIHWFVCGKGRQLGICLDPQTRVLTADLRWICIAELTPGTEIISVDEHSEGPRCGRKMRSGLVEAVVRVRRPAYRITFDDGRSLICTGQHPWLSRKNDTAWFWRSIEEPRPDLNQGNSQGILEIGTKVRWATRAPGDLEDGFFKSRFWENRAVPGDYATITNIEFVGERDLVDLQTSRGTYIAEGFVSHNTTACLMFDVFYAGAVDDLMAGFVVDTDSNKEKFRAVLKEMMELLPPSHRLPVARGGDNRNFLRLQNGNILDYLVAGTKRGLGTLGRSRSLNFVHATECRSYGDEESIEAFKDTLSEIFPWRLYLWETTGKGYNLFYDLWEEAIADSITKQTIFVTWWRKRTYSYRRNTPLFERYGWPERSKDELEAEAIVKRDYGHQITDEQWAWYRHRSDPIARAEEHDEDEPQDFRQEVVTQEHPHFPDQMFRGTGSPFMPNEFLAPAFERALKLKFRGYHYHLGDSLDAMRLVPTKFLKFAQLKVWEPPSPIGEYILGADTAYGISDRGDAFCVQVVRCFADRMVQVAEFRDPNIQPFQFAWVLLHLAGWYGLCRYVLELNGSGEAVWNELRNLKQLVEKGLIKPPPFDPPDREQPLEPPDPDIAPVNDPRRAYSHVTQYLYRRSDSLMGGGFNYHMRCLSIDEVLPTPEGWVRMEDVKPGDQVFDERGVACPVNAVSEIKLGHDCFRLVFDDGSSIVADAEHLWPIEDYWPTRTVDLRPGADEIALTGPLDIEPKELPIDPYVLGAWLGGSKDVSGIVGQVGIHDLQVSLRDLSVLGDKHIPQIYLRGSRLQREELLLGLMNTDGTLGFNSDRQCSFATTNLKIADGFAELLRTLGIKPHFQTLNAESYHFFWFTGGSPEAWRHHRLIAVEPVPSVPVRCIEVYSPSHLYLAGVGMIPTHNTTLETKFTFMMQFADRFMLNEFEINSVPCLEEMKRLKKDGRSLEPEGKGKDDRPISCGLATRAYMDDVRKKLVSENRTYAIEMQREAMGGAEDSMQARYMQMMMQTALAGKATARRQVRRTERRQRWGW